MSIFRNTTSLVATFFLTLAESLSTLAQSPPFEGWVRYEIQSSQNPTITKSRYWDTLFIGNKEGVLKSCGLTLFLAADVTVVSESFLVYSREVRRLIYWRRQRSDEGEKPDREMIYPDSLERLRLPSMEVESLDSSKVILGYFCRQARLRLTFPRPDTVPVVRHITVFYTDQLPNVESNFKGLGGLPLEYWSIVPMPGRPNGYWSRYVATAIGQGPVPQGYFNPRSLYPDREVVSGVWNGKRETFKAPPPPPKPARLRAPKKKYPWSGKN
jgi:hypothetical protein